MITPKPARPYEREPVRKAKQAALHAALKAEIQQKQETLRGNLIASLKAIESKVSVMKTDFHQNDPFPAERAKFADMPPMTAGREMASAIVADMKADAELQRMIDAGIAGAIDEDLAMYDEWPELDDVEFQRTGGLV